jgi:hypothetical protein
MHDSSDLDTDSDATPMKRPIPLRGACGRCGLAMFASVAMPIHSLGWRFVVKYGWVCPACAEMT